MPAVTLLQATTLGRQSLAAGVRVDVDAAQASAWAAAGIILAQTANEPEQAPALVAHEVDATKEVAKAPETDKTAPKRKRG